MHSGGHGRTLRSEFPQLRQRLSIQANLKRIQILPKETRDSRKTTLGKLQPSPRQTLTTPQVFPPQQKQVVLTPLLAPRRFLPI